MVRMRVSVNLRSDKILMTFEALTLTFDFVSYFRILYTQGLRFPIVAV